MLQIGRCFDQIGHKIDTPLQEVYNPARFRAAVDRGLRRARSPVLILTGNRSSQSPVPSPKLSGHQHCLFVRPITTLQVGQTFSDGKRSQLFFPPNMVMSSRKSGGTSWRGRARGKIRGRVNISAVADLMTMFGPRSVPRRRVPDSMWVTLRPIALATWAARAESSWNLDSGMERTKSS